MKKVLITTGLILLGAVAMDYYNLMAAKKAGVAKKGGLFNTK